MSLLSCYLENLYNKWNGGNTNRTFTSINVGDKFNNENKQYKS